MSNNILNEGIELLNSGLTIKEIVKKLDISLDKAKKISQIANMNEIISVLNPNLKDKFKKLGFKVLVLNPLFKDGDINGIKEILESVDISIKRDELKILPEALKIKRERLKNAKIRAKYAIENLEQIESEIEKNILENKANKKKIDESIGFLNDVENKKAKEFLMEHLGVAKGKIVLYKRLDIAWQQSLKRNGVIKYNNSDYTWEITNLDELKRQTEKRVIKNNNMFYDCNKATGMYADRYPEDPVYKKAEGLNVSIMDSLKENEKQIKELRRKKREVNRELKELKGTKVQSYIESAEIANYLSEHEILTHRRLQNSGMRYLYNNEHVSIVELSQDTYRFDVIGYDKNGLLTIIEAKASIEDFRADEKFNRYITYCNKMYFIFTENTFIRYENEIYKKIKPYKIGVLIESKNNAICKIESDIWNSKMEQKQELIFKINRILSRKFIYGR